MTTSQLSLLLKIKYRLYIYIFRPLLYLQPTTHQEGPVCLQRPTVWLQLISAY